MVVISLALNGQDTVLAPKQLQALSTDVRHREKLIDFIYKNGSAKELYIMTVIFQYNLDQDEMEEVNTGLDTNRQMTMDPIYGQILFNCCHSNAVKMKLGHHAKIFLVEINRATDMEIAEHIIGPPKVIATNRVKARCTQLPTIIYRLWKVLNMVERRRERRMVGKRMILVLM
jgi:hypothetical protein